MEGKKMYEKQLGGGYYRRVFMSFVFRTNPGYAEGYFLALHSGIFYGRF